MFPLVVRGFYGWSFACHMVAVFLFFVRFIRHIDVSPARYFQTWCCYGGCVVFPVVSAFALFSLWEWSCACHMVAVFLSFV